jgi:hypothetical protein
MTDIQDTAAMVAMDALPMLGASRARAAVAALHRAGMICDPARLAALEAVAEAARDFRAAQRYEFWRTLDKALVALDAAASGETEEEVCRCGHPEWKGYKHCIGTPCIRIRP